MPCTLHETFAIKVNNEIQRFLDTHTSSRNDSTIAKIAGSIDGTGSQTICPPELEYNGKGPDMSFHLDGCAYPGLVVEVAWAQDKSEMKEKAKYYFESTHGEVRTVVGFNLNDIYKKQQAAEKRWATNTKMREKRQLASAPEPLTFLAPAAAPASADFSVWRAKHNSLTGETIIGRDSIQEQVPSQAPRDLQLISLPKTVLYRFFEMPISSTTRTSVLNSPWKISCAKEQWTSYARRRAGYRRSNTLNSRYHRNCSATGWKGQFKGIAHNGSEIRNEKRT